MKRLTIWTYLMVCLLGGSLWADEPVVVAQWKHTPGNGVNSFYSNGKINDPNGSHTWTRNDRKLVLRWKDPKAPGGFWVDTCTISPDGKTYSGTNQLGLRVGGVLVKESPAAKESPKEKESPAIGAANGWKVSDTPAAKPVDPPTAQLPPNPDAAKPRADVVLQLGHLQEFEWGVFSRDRKLILTASKDTAILWDTIDGRQIRTFQHPAPIQSIDISPNGERVLISASIGVRGRLHMWDTTTGKEVWKQPIPTGQRGNYDFCSKILFSPDGRSVLLDANGLRLWEVATGKEIQEFESPKGLITASAAFSPNGLWVLTGNSDKTARLWDMTAGEQAALLEGHSEKVSAVGFSPDSKQVFTVSGNQVRLWDRASGMLKDTSVLNNARSYGDSQAVSPNGKYLLTSGFYLNDREKELAKLWDLTSGKVLHEFPLTTRGNGGGKAVFSPDGKQIYIACDDGTARLWDPEFPAREPVVLEGKTDSIESVYFSADGAQVLIGQGDGSTRLRDLATGKVARVFPGHVGMLTLNDKCVITGPPTDNIGHRQRSKTVDFNQRIRVWDTASGKLLHELEGGSPICVSADGKKLLVFSRVPLEGQRKDIRGLTRMHLEVWDTTSGNKVRDIPMPLSLSLMGSVIQSGAFSPKGTQVAFTAWEQGCWLWDFASETIRPVTHQAFGPTYSVAFSPDGKLLLVGRHDKAELIRLDEKVKKMALRQQAVNERGQRTNFEFAGIADDVVIKKYTGGPVYIETVLYSEDKIYSVAFSPDGKQILTGHPDSKARLWSIENGKELMSLSGHEGRDVRFVTFSPDGKKVLTAGSGGELRLWEAKTGRELMKMFNFRDGSWVAITPGDNYYLASRGRLDGIGFALGNSIYSFDQFDLKFNRPDKVIARVGMASPEVIAAHRHAYEKRLHRMNLTEEMLGDDFQIPKVVSSIVSPADKARRSISISVEASDSKYLLDRLYISVNGVPIQGIAGLDLRKKAIKTYQQEVEVELSSGKNRIDVSVLNEKGVESLKSSLSVQCDAPAQKPNLYVVAVGVSDYADVKFRLTYADKDARDLAKLLEDKKVHYGEVKILRVLNRDATRENILKAAEFLKPAKVDDTVVLFFAGHGLLDTKLDYYFATADINFAEPDKRGLAYEAIEGLLDGVRARRKLLLMDTCHSGELDKEEIQIAKEEQKKGEEIKVRGFRSGLIPENTPKVGLGNSYQLLQGMFADLRRGTGAVVIASAGGAEYAMESPEWNNGVFTHALLRGLKGEADRNKDGRVQASELRDFVELEVGRLTGGRQTPTARRENLIVDFAFEK